MQYKLFKNVEEMKNNEDIRLLPQISKVRNIDWNGDYLDENNVRQEILEYWLEFVDGSTGNFYRLGEDPNAPFLEEQPSIDFTPQGQDVRPKPADEVMTVKQLKELYREYREKSDDNERKQEIWNELYKVGLSIIYPLDYKVTAYIDLLDK